MRLGPTSPRAFFTWQRGVLVALSLALWLVTAGCDAVSDRFSNRSEHGRESSGASKGAVRQFSDDDLQRLLLPDGAVSGALTPSGRYGLSNATVAQLFDDTPGALRELDRLGRVHGAGLDFVLRGGPRPGDAAVQVTSTVSWYGTVAGADAVVRDPAAELVFHRLGLAVGEIAIEEIAEASRGFRGIVYRDGIALASYAVVFRRLNVVGSVLVFIPVASDDGGKLAVQLARRQAAMPWPVPPR